MTNNNCLILEVKMNKIKLLYNPKSGPGNFSNKIDNFLNEFQPEYDIDINRLINFDLMKKFSKIKDEEYDTIIVAGGDGTVHSVANAMLKNNIKIPLAILPTGTINDFAATLNLRNNFNSLFELINNKKIKKIDVGKVNDEYFINVCSGGFITTIPHKTDAKLKNKLGKVAYYLKGIQEFPGFKSLPLKIITDDKEFTENIFMFLLMNSSRAGGYKNINPQNSLDDGLFELIAIKYTNLYEMTNSLIDLFINKNLDNKNIIYLKTSRLEVIPLKKSLEDHTDLDGERGPDYPLDIKIIPKSLSVYTYI